VYATLDNRKVSGYPCMRLFLLPALLASCSTLQVGSQEEQTLAHARVRGLLTDYYDTGAPVPYRRSIAQLCADDNREAVTASVFLRCLLHTLALDAQRADAPSSLMPPRPSQRRLALELLRTILLDIEQKRSAKPVLADTVLWVLSSAEIPGSGAHEAAGRIVARIVDPRVDQEFVRLVTAGRPNKALLRIAASEVAARRLTISSRALGKLLQHYDVGVRSIANTILASGVVSADGVNSDPPWEEAYVAGWIEDVQDSLGGILPNTAEWVETFEGDHIVLARTGFLCQIEGLWFLWGMHGRIESVEGRQNLGQEGQSGHSVRCLLDSRLAFKESETANDRSRLRDKFGALRTSLAQLDDLPPVAADVLLMLWSVREGRTQELARLVTPLLQTHESAFVVTEALLARVAEMIERCMLECFGSNRMEVASSMAHVLASSTFGKHETHWVGMRMLAQIPQLQKRATEVEMPDAQAWRTIVERTTRREQVAYLVARLPLVQGRYWFPSPGVRARLGIPGPVKQGEEGDSVPINPVVELQEMGVRGDEVEAVIDLLMNTDFVRVYEDIPNARRYHLHEVREVAGYVIGNIANGPSIHWKSLEGSDRENYMEELRKWCRSQVGR